MTLHSAGTPAAFDGDQARKAGGPPERDTPMTGIYVRVLILEAAIVIALWFFGKMFS